MFRGISLTTSVFYTHFWYEYMVGTAATSITRHVVAGRWLESDTRP